MKLSFSTLGCPGWYWDDIVTVAKDLQYHGIEVRGVHKEIYVPAAKPFLPANIESTKERLRRLKLSIPCITSSCDLHVRERMEDNLREGREYIDLAATLGVPYVRVLGDQDPAPAGDVDTVLVKEMLSALGDYAAEQKVTILIETNGYFSKSERLAKLVQAVNHPHVAVLWDIHHPYRYMDEQPEQTYDNLAAYIRHVHVKDSMHTGEKVRYVLPGEGDVPIQKSVEILQDHDFQGFYSLEWVKRWDLSLEEPGIVFAQYIAYMKRLGCKDNGGCGRI